MTVLMPRISGTIQCQPRRLPFNEETGIEGEDDDMMCSKLTMYSAWSHAIKRLSSFKAGKSITNVKGARSFLKFFDDVKGKKNALL